MKMGGDFQKLNYLSPYSQDIENAIRTNLEKTFESSIISKIVINNAHDLDL